MSETTFRLARLGEDAAIIDFINDNFDMRLPLLNRPRVVPPLLRRAAAVCPSLPWRRRTASTSARPGTYCQHPAPPRCLGQRLGGRQGPQRRGAGADERPARLLNADVVACNNIRPNTCTFYQFLGWQAERLPHYYRLGRRRAYYLAKPLRYSLPHVPARFRAGQGGERRGPAPAGYARHAPHTAQGCVVHAAAVFHYPHFKYDVWAACENNKLLAYVVTRTVSAEETGCAAVVRLVDFIGEDTVLPRLGAALDAILNHAGAEYMDCYNAGIPADVWLAAGFTERVEGDGCIIPNYLTPPLHENTEYYYFTNKPENFVMFKADGDQDRPNLKINQNTRCEGRRVPRFDTPAPAPI